MKSILRSGAAAAAFGAGLSLVVLPAVPANAAAAIRVPCNDITALKDAIDRADAGAGPGRIVLASHCTYNLTTVDTSAGLPDITGNVTISGRDATIRRAPSATQDFRIFHVVSGGTLTLDSITVSGGRVGGIAGGGGIAVDDGTLNLNRTRITGNQSGLGGGLYNDGGTLDLDRSTVERNSASAFGGGIFNAEGTLTMKGGALRGNRALAQGGGLDNASGTARLKDVTIKGNTAQQGGGILQVNEAQLRLTSSTVRENIAVNGAGISNTSSSRATLIRSLVTRNTAITAGGGIQNASPSQVVLKSSKVVRNRPDDCSPAGSVPRCTDPGRTAAEPKTLPAPQPPRSAR